METTTPSPRAAACSLNRAVATAHLPITRVIVSFMIRIAVAEPSLTGSSCYPGPNQAPTTPDYARPSETFPDTKLTLNCGNRTSATPSDGIVLHGMHVGGAHRARIFLEISPGPLTG